MTAVKAKLADNVLKDLVAKLESGDITPRQIEDFVEGCSNKAADVRLAFLESRAGIKTEHIGRHTIDFNLSHGSTTTNEIGAVQTPLTFCGFLKVNGEFAGGEYPIIIAKPEGMLTEGMGRGIGVVNSAGGITTVITKDGMARDILVGTSGIVESKKLIEWIKSNEGLEFISEEFAKHVGNHGEFTEITAKFVGGDVHLRFVGTTGAVNGMNKITIASSRTVKAMIDHLKTLEMDLTLVSESGNMCTDKKPSQVNNILGRGASAHADITIPREIVEAKFKKTPEEIVDLNTRKNLLGSIMAGSAGANAHIANPIGGIYSATGQDSAHVIGPSSGITYMKVDGNGNLYVAVSIPALEIATYGGATRNETYREVLQLMGLYGEGDDAGKTRLALAEVTIAACLVGELNLIAVQAKTDLANSHSSLKRG